MTDKRSVQALAHCAHIPRSILDLGEVAFVDAPFGNDLRGETSRSRVAPHALDAGSTIARRSLFA
jgi:hypothetical protein